MNIDNEEQVLIYNVVGKKMKYSLYGNILDITNLQKGIYFLKINNNKSFKIIKE
jgi:hypothetical protein